MKSDEYFVPFAESAFNAYGDKAEWKTWDNKPMPKWDAVGEAVQARWLAAIKDVFRKLEVRTEDGEPFVDPVYSPQFLKEHEEMIGQLNDGTYPHDLSAKE